MKLSSHFSTKVFTDCLAAPGLRRQLLAEIEDIMDLDAAGAASP